MNTTLRSRIQMLTDIVGVMDERIGGKIDWFVNGIVDDAVNGGLTSGCGYANACGRLMAFVESLLFHARGVVEAAGLDPSPVCCNVGPCRPLAEVPEAELVEMARTAS